MKPGNCGICRAIRVKNMNPNNFDFDRSDIHLKYNAARKLPDATVRLWMDEIAKSVAYKIDTIIDLGCGTGRFSEPLQRRFDADVIGVDPSEKMLGVAKSEISNGRIRFAPGNALSIPVNHTVSMVFMSTPLRKCLMQCNQYWILSLSIGLRAFCRTLLSWHSTSRVFRYSGTSMLK